MKVGEINKSLSTLFGLELFQVEYGLVKGHVCLLEHTSLWWVGPISDLPAAVKQFPKANKIGFYEGDLLNLRKQLGEAMSTEAMIKAFKVAVYENNGGREWRKEDLWEAAWQAATANQDALIRAAIEYCAKYVDEYGEGRYFATAIRQITPEQILASIK